MPTRCELLHGDDGGVGVHAGILMVPAIHEPAHCALHELWQVAGMKSAQVREVLPRATDEAVHRDYFVLA